MKTMQRNHQNALVSALVVGAAALSGCFGDDGRVAANAEVSFSGSEPGTDQDSADCDSDGRLNFVGNLNEGQITVSVRDGANKETFHQTFTGNLEGETEGVNGEAGRWTLQVDRSADFDGSYTVSLTC